MQILKILIHAIATRTTILTLIIIYVVSTYLFFSFLDVIGDQFREVTGGLTFLDTQAYYSPDTILDQVPRYNFEAKSLLWDFNIVDNVFPVLNSFLAALLWMKVWTRNPNRLYNGLANGYWVLLALLPGFFDVMENFASLPVVMSNGVDASALRLWAIVLVHNLKIIAIILTTIATYLFILSHLIFAVRNLTRNPPP